MFLSLQTETRLFLLSSEQKYPNHTHKDIFAPLAHVYACKAQRLHDNKSYEKPVSQDDITPPEELCIIFFHTSKWKHC